MDSRIAIGGGVVAVCIVIAIVLLMNSGPQEPGELDDFAKCLTGKGLTMYGTGWCSHCQNQKDDFGSSFQYVNFVDCDRESDRCDSAGVSGYPTWIYNGEQFRGEQSLSFLSDITGCER
jgi:hypothetical protein